MDSKLQLYERAQEAAAAGKFDEADKALALADKLALHLPTPTVPPAGAAAAPPPGEGRTHSSAIASQPKADTGLLRTPLPSGKDSALAASRVPAAAPVPPADPQNGAQRIGDPILIIHFSKGSALAPAEIHQLTAILGSRFSRIKLAGEDRIRPNAIIQYYSLRDHPITKDIGRELGRMGYQWRIEHVTTERDESPSDIVDVWIPPK
jgi:hypothetical protein